MNVKSMIGSQEDYQYLKDLNSMNRNFSIQNSARRFNIPCAKKVKRLARIKLLRK